MQGSGETLSTEIDCWGLRSALEELLMPWADKQQHSTALRGSDISAISRVMGASRWIGPVRQERSSFFYTQKEEIFHNRTLLPAPGRQSRGRSPGEVPLPVANSSPLMCKFWKPHLRNPGTPESSRKLNSSGRLFTVLGNKVLMSHKAKKNLNMEML